MSLDAFPGFRDAITVSGAAALFVFAGLQARSAISGRNLKNPGSGSGPFVAGIMFSALNPFFIVWWLTVGLKLVSDAMLIWAFGGALVVFMLHIWMDFAWLGSVAFLASRGSRRGLAQCLSILEHRFWRTLA